MPFLYGNERSSKGFKFTGHIDKYLLIKNGTLFTEESIVDGMPDVKWSLKFNVNSSETDQTGMYLEINTAENVDWIVNFDFGSFARQNTQGSSKGLRKILFYEFTANDLFNSCFLKSYEKIPYTIDAAFSNQSSQKFNTPIICNPVEWGLRLQQNSAEDFEFLVDGETFPIHKLIIAAESPVFKKMFEHDFKEAAEKKVTITDFSIDTVKAFIDFCYGKYISTFFENESDSIDLLRFSDKYDCRTLKPQLETFLASKLSKENISLYVSAVNQANALQLRQACVEFVRKIFYDDQSLSDEEMESFDMKFMKDVFAFSRKI